MTASDVTVLESVLRRDRLLVTAALVGAIAWIWVLLGAGLGMSAGGMTRGSGMPGMTDMMMAPAVWTPGYALLMVAMWWVMMAAMMLPSAAPMLLLFARVNRTERAAKDPSCRPGSLALGTSRPGAGSARSPPACSGNWSGSACCRR